LGHIVVYEDGVVSMPKITDDAVRYQAQFVVAEEPEPHVRECIEQDFDRRLADVPIVWLPDDYWQQPMEQWLVEEIADVTSFI
jgi:hypothetical protein